MNEPIDPAKAMKVFTIQTGEDICPGGVYVVTDHVEAGKVTRLPGVLPFRSIEAARSLIQSRNPSHVRFNRDHSDDPRILESWL